MLVKESNMNILKIKKIESSPNLKFVFEILKDVSLEKGDSLVLDFNSWSMKGLIYEEDNVNTITIIVERKKESK